ncbi:MAG: vWA domain-containing protein, partial [Verrucomicrobiales bacterium]
MRNTLKTRLDMANHALLVSKEMEEPRNAESYAPTVDNAFKDIVNPGDERATFSTDVDTASYSNVRRFLTNGQRPPRDAIRVEEMINYFYYDYPNPAEDGKPFSVKLEVNDAPWAPGHRLLRIGLKARDVMVDKRPDSNLVFLIDVSGSMSPFDKLPLLKKSLKAMVGGFTERDMVSLVVYFGQSRVHLPPTPGNESSRIIASVDQLKSGGSTNGASGIQLAYELASKHRIVNGVNRVLLATDGDFNVGTTDTKQLIAMAKARAKEDQ